MAKSPAPQSYNVVAKFFHWSMALLIVGMLGIGLYMEEMPYSPAKFQLIQLHKSVGILILVMVILRLVWRLSNKIPPLPQMPWYQKAAAHLTHYGLYYLMFAIPMTGYVMSDAAGYHPNFFGLPVPILSEPNPETAKFLGELHETFAWVLMGVIALHVAAALYHHVIVKDDTLKRMLPTCRKSLPLVAAMLLLPAASFAATSWQINPATSTLGWKVAFNGQPVSGKFNQWTGTINFDAASLDTSKILITVDLASVNSGDENRDGTLKGADFFNVAATPKAVFESTKITKTATGYVASGNLTIAGVTKPAALPFTLAITGSQAVANGKLVISRTAYGVGKGQWASAKEIADAVEVTFTVNATANGK